MLASLAVTRYQNVTANPVISDIERVVRLIANDKVDMIVAIGGGSVLDTAKLVSITARNPAAMSSPGIDGIFEPGIPLVAIPTTAGTGSEATHFATYYENGIKHSLAHASLRPDYAIVDPLLTYSLPPLETAHTGFDALSQAIESWWAVGATEESQGYAARSMQLALGALRDAVVDPTPGARSDMATAAWLAGQAIDISRTTAPHALSYVLTADFGVPHGQAVALTLCAFLEFNACPGGRPINDPRGAAYLANTMRRLVLLMGHNSVSEAARALRLLMGDIGLASSLPSLGIDDRRVVARLVENVNVERLGNNPVKLDEQDLTAICNALFPLADNGPAW